MFGGFARGISDIATLIHIQRATAFIFYILEQFALIDGRFRSYKSFMNGVIVINNKK